MRFRVLSKEYQVVDTTTICKIHCILKELQSLAYTYPEVKAILKKYGLTPYGAITVEGTAYLKTGDTYDALVGKRVAESKAMRKLFYKMTKLNLELANLATTKLDNDLDKYFQALEHEKIHFKTLCK